MIMQNKKPDTAGRKAFTVVEILLAVAVIGVLFALIFAFYRSAINKSKYVEAVATVDTISKAEEIKQMNTGEYVAAANTQEVNERLGLDIKPRWYNYKVIGVTDDNFIVLAEKILDDINSGNLSSEPLVIARDRSGPVSPDSIGPSGTADIPPVEEPPGGSSSPSGGGSPGGGGGGGTPTGGNPTGSPAGSSDNTTYADLTQALSLLRGTTNGDYYYNLLVNNSIPINWAPLGENTGAQCSIAYTSSSVTCTIQVNQALENIWTSTQIAPLIVHEALHADCAYDPTKWADIMLGQLNTGRPPPPLLVSANLDWFTVGGTQYLNDTVQQEYNTFKQEVLLWQEIHGSERSTEYDNLLTKYNNDLANGTTEFYDEVASRYPTLEAY